MAGVKVQVPVPALAVPPGHPVRHGRPEKHDTAPHDKLLVETGTGNVNVECGIGFYLGRAGG